MSDPHITFSKVSILDLSIDTPRVSRKLINRIKFGPKRRRAISEWSQAPSTSPPCGPFTQRRPEDTCIASHSISSSTSQTHGGPSNLTQATDALFGVLYGGRVNYVIPQYSCAMPVVDFTLIWCWQVAMAAVLQWPLGGRSIIMREETEDCIKPHLSHFPSPFSTIPQSACSSLSFSLTLFVLPFPTLTSYVLCLWISVLKTFVTCSCLTFFLTY